MTPAKCNYHPNMEAIDRCPSCNKDICIQCQKIYGEINKSEGIQTIIEHQICPVCYWEYRISKIKNKASNLFKKYISILFSVILVVFDILISYLIFFYFSLGNYFAFYVPFLCVLSIQMFFIIGILSLKRMREEPSEISSLKYQKEKFLERSFELQNYLIQNT